jgi:Ser/Thr protein kinase RdoA (MazF antagonist)
MIKKSLPSGATPFAGLSPDVVLDAAASLGFESDGRLFALNSYENRVYQLGHGEGAWVLKFYRPERWSDAQILEEHAFTVELAEAEMAVAAPIEMQQRTLFRHRDFRFAVFPWKAGRAPELDGPGAREVLGRAIARMHRIGGVRDFEVRPVLSVERLGAKARKVVIKSQLLPEALHESYERASGALLERIDRAFESTGEPRALRIHGDCHLGNLLWNEQGPVFVDLDDCIMGPGIQDLWMLLSGSPADQQRQWQELLEGYQTFADFDFRELLLIEPLRGLRMMHHAAWIAQRWSDPAFPRAFPWFGERRYWEAHIGDLLEQLAAIDTPPLLCS